MASVAEAKQTSARPPDILGESGPLPRGILWLGAIALILVTAGTLGVQIYYAVRGGAVTEYCLSLGIEQFHPQTGSKPASGFNGARGVCNIVMALRDPATTVLLLLGIAMGLAAIAAGFWLFRRQDSRRKREQCITGAVLGIQAVLAAGLLLWFRSGRPDRFVISFLNFEVLKGSVPGFVKAAKNTLVLAFGGEIGGIIVGLVLALLAVSARRAVRAPARAYINFFRGTPLIWQLSFFWFGMVLGLQLPLRENVFLAAIIVFVLNTGAYAAEVFRAGIQSIERGQIEAARSLGMTYIQAMRYAIVPQAVRRVVPPLMNEFVILIKDTSLVIVLGLTAEQLELYNYAREGYSDTANATWFVGAAIGYLAVTLSLIRLVNIAESRIRSGLVGIGG